MIDGLILLYSIYIYYHSVLNKVHIRNAMEACLVNLICNNGKYTNINSLH